MKLTIEIDLENDAFGDEPVYEVARILRELADDMEGDGFMAQRIKDINGNTVGQSVVSK